MQSEILIIGSSNTDMVIKAEKLPLPGETVLGGEFFMSQGGKGANQAVAAARLGGQVTFVAKLGDDMFGQQALQQYKREGINTDFVVIDPEYPSGVALISVDAKGENCISVAPGANGQLMPTEVGKALASLKTEALVLLQLEIPLATVQHAVLESFKKGHNVILNPAPAQVLPVEIFSKLYLITPNETEAELLTGVKVTDSETARTAAQELKKLGVANVIITLGAKGAYLLTDSTSEVILAPKVEAVDTTAAGDCFNGALVVALAEGKALPDAVAFACQAAALSVTRVGAQTSIPFLEELNTLPAAFSL